MHNSAIFMKYIFENVQGSAQKFHLYYVCITCICGQMLGVCYARGILSTKDTMAIFLEASWMFMLGWYSDLNIERFSWQFILYLDFLHRPWPLCSYNCSISRSSHLFVVFKYNRNVLFKNSHKFQIILWSRNIVSFVVKSFMMVAIDLV